MMFSIVFAAFFFVNFNLFFSADAFSAPGTQFLKISSSKAASSSANGTKAEELDLATELGIKGRFDELEAILTPMYNSLAKDENGRIGFPSVRYALHRAMVQRQGWYIRGLAPDGKAWQAASPKESLKDWATSRLLGPIERRMDGGGFSLHETIALAAAIEDIARDEADGRLQAIYRLHNVDMEAAEPLDGQIAKNLLDHYMLIYINTNNFNPKTKKEAMHRITHFRHKWKGWKPLEAWLRELQRNITGTPIGSSLEFPKALRVAEEVGTHYASYDKSVCSGLKEVLLSMEGDRPGRVPLSSFYSKGMTKDTFFRFTETLPYLRDLGALDDSDRLNPSVIIPNYITGRHNCLEASKIYAVCCRNECEDLLTYIEKEIAESDASPERIVEVLQAAPASIVKAPPQLSDHLRGLLQQVSEINGGRVPLHGRLFAQWLHHVFPHECPYPHEAGTTSPKGPEEWMKMTGYVTTEASEEEMVCYMNGPCLGGVDAASGSGTPSAGFLGKGGNMSVAQFASTGALKLDVKAVPAQASTELPWTDKEELLVVYSNENKPADAEGFNLPPMIRQGGVVGALMVGLSALSIYNIYMWGLSGQEASAVIA